MFVTHLDYAGSDRVHGIVAIDRYFELVVGLPLRGGVENGRAVFSAGARVAVKPRQHIATHHVYQIIGLLVAFAPAMYTLDTRIGYDDQQNHDVCTVLKPTVNKLLVHPLAHN